MQPDRPSPSPRLLAVLAANLIFLYALGVWLLAETPAICTFPPAVMLMAGVGWLGHRHSRPAHS